MNAAKFGISDHNPFEQVDEFRAYAEQITDLQRQVKILMECVTFLMRSHTGKTNGLPHIPKTELVKTGDDAP